jgi:putative tricarboxylic transport membrane protein
MKKHDCVTGLVWFALGIGICIGSIKLKLGNLNTPGPGFLPFLSGASLGLFGLILTFLATRAGLEERENVKGQKNLVNWDWKRVINPLITLFILVVYVLALEPLGFLLTTFICLLLLFKLPEPKEWLMPLVLSFSATAFSYLLFSVWLQCQFPKGLIRFL